MIIVRIWEGLGNQLFQYAYARALQQRVKTEVYLDVRHCNRGDLSFERKDIVTRKQGLHHFNVSLKCADTSKIPVLHCLEGKSMIDRTMYLLMKKKPGRWRILDDAEMMTDMCQDLVNPGDFRYVNAHCINKGYYEDCREILLKELQLKKPPVLSEPLKDIMLHHNTVSLHIRLTDYLRNPGAICSQQYYDRAVQYINDHVDHPYFIIFTDDPHMAQKRYRFQGNVYWVSEDGYRDYEELFIMSRCRHNIIAESTFSYWGAWLNQNQGKIVIGSRKWFHGKLYDKDWKVF